MTINSQLTSTLALIKILIRINDKKKGIYNIISFAIGNNTEFGEYTSGFALDFRWKYVNVQISELIITFSDIGNPGKRDKCEMDCFE